MQDISHLDKIHFDTHMLQYLISIADEDSLTKAAEKHFLSQPAMSRYLKDMERLLDTDLFIRSHNHLQLTEAGKIFINGARSIVHIEQEMEKRLRDMADDHTAAIKIAGPAYFLKQLDDQFLPIWRENHSDAVITLSAMNSDAVLTAVRMGKCDIGLLFGEVPSSSICNAQQLFLSEMVCCLPSGQPIEKTFSGAEQYLEHHRDTGVFLAAGETAIRTIQEHFLRDCGVSLSNIQAAAALSILMELFQMGHGPILLPFDCVKDVSKDQLLHFSRAATVPFQLVWQKNQYTMPGVRSLIEEIGQFSRRI